MATENRNQCKNYTLNRLQTVFNFINNSKKN